MSITFPGIKTNISQFTVGHVGHKDQPLLSLIDSISYSKIRAPPQLLSMLRSLLTVELVDHAMVVTPEESMNLPLKKVFLIHLVNNMLLKILLDHVQLLTNVKIAHGLLAPKDKLAKINVGLLIINIIM